jgi:hypothetical protein
MVRFATLMSLVLLVGCNKAPEGSGMVAPGPRTERTSAVAPARPEAVSAVAAPAPSGLVAATVSERNAATKTHMPSTLPSTLKVKRLVVTTGVKDREPLSNPTVLPSDGSAIYAFAELSNPDGESENVRITFERKGGAERVGNVTLPVPGKVARHRTWATTRFIRAAGVWEAVLWSETGSELGRTSFEVASS